MIFLKLSVLSSWRKDFELFEAKFGVLAKNVSFPVYIRNHCLFIFFMVLNMMTNVDRQKWPFSSRNEKWCLPINDLWTNI